MQRALDGRDGVLEIRPLISERRKEEPQQEQGDEADERRVEQTGGRTRYHGRKGDGGGHPLAAALGRGSQDCPEPRGCRMDPS